MTEALFPHQFDAAIRVANQRPTYLGFDMGTGKTRTFIEAVRQRELLDGPQRVLVICPLSAVLVWLREIEKWHPSASARVAKEPSALLTRHTYTIITHGTMSQKNGDVARGLATLLYPFDMTAIDEAHGFNAPNNNRVEALRRAKVKLGHIIPLSGTPQRNHHGELYTLLDICWPQGLKGMTRHQFEDRFCHVAMKKFNRAMQPVRVIEGSKNTEQLRALIAPFMVRVRKNDVLTALPPINWDTVPVVLDTSAMPVSDVNKLGAMIGDLMDNNLTEGSNIVAADAFLGALGKKLVSSSSLALMRRMLGLAKLRGATEYIVDMLDNLPRDRKVLVFAHHKDVIKALHEHLAEYDPALVTGETTPRERVDAVDKFLTKDQCRVFIGNIQAAGTALTLVGPRCKCSDVVFVESSWTPMDNAQAACRVHRIGQHDGVVARMLSAAGTVDDLLHTILARKAREFTQLFDTTGEGAT